MNIDHAEIDFRTLRTEAEVRAIGKPSGVPRYSRRPVVIELDDVEFDTDDEDGVVNLQVLVILDGYVRADPGSRDEPALAAAYEDCLGVWVQWPTLHGDRSWAEVLPGSDFYENQCELAQEVALEDREFSW